jgi:Pyruvate/2-oxoacid:ferredoxin oxidoreductase gamma subunit
MLGALIKAKPLVTTDSLSKALLKRFRKDIAEKNIEVMLRANEEVVVE